MHCEYGLGIPERELDVVKERFNIALKAAKMCIFEVNIKEQYYTCFENAEDIFGVCGRKILEDVRKYSVLPREEYQKAVTDYFVCPEDSEAVNQAFKNTFHGKDSTYIARMKAGDSSYVWCKVDISPVTEKGETVRMIGVITDISEIKAKEDMLEQKSLVDAFTGLYNKGYSKKAIEHILIRDNCKKHALILIDIDNFKYFNDTMGHAAGDDIILAVAKNLKNTFRKSDIVGRFGGDEFIILMENITDSKNVSEKLEKLVEGEVGRYTNSIGVAVFPDDGRTFEELFDNADRALYYSKKIKKTFTFFKNL